MSELGQLMDHAAELQQQVDQLSSEILVLAIAGLALALACLVMGWQLWRT